MRYRDPAKEKRAPHKVLLRSVLDGNVIELIDDGYGLDSQDEPGQARQHLSNMLKKRAPDGGKVYFSVRLDGFDEVDREVETIVKGKKRKIKVKDKTPRYVPHVEQPWSSPDGARFAPIDAPPWDEKCDERLERFAAEKALADKMAEERLLQNMFSRSAFTLAVNQAQEREAEEESAALARVDALEKQLAEVTAKLNAKSGRGAA